MGLDGRCHAEIAPEGEHDLSLKHWRGVIGLSGRRHFDHDHAGHAGVDVAVVVKQSGFFKRQRVRVLQLLKTYPVRMRLKGRSAGLGTKLGRPSSLATADLHRYIFRVQ